MRSYDLHLSANETQRLASFLADAVVDASTDSDALATALPFIKKRKASGEITSSLSALCKVPAAFYALSDEQNWRSSLRTIVAFDFADLPEPMALTPFFAAYYLSACLLLRDHERGSRFALRLRPPELNKLLPHGGVTRILAALTTGDQDAALAGTALMRASIAERKFDRHSCNRYQTWCEAVDAFIARDDLRLVSALDAIWDQLSRHLRAEYRKWASNRPSDFRPRSFWDHETSAILSVANRARMKIPTSSTFFDIGWLKNED